VVDRTDASTTTSLDRAAFDEACARLGRAGYHLVPGGVAWLAFEASRAAYDGRLEAMAAYWATPTNSWLEPELTLSSPAHLADAPDDEGYAPS
jgi:hypothetical protein